MFFRTRFGRRSRCFMVLFGILVAATLLYVFRRCHPHINSLALLIQNKYYNQLFRLAPPLQADPSNVSVLLFWTPFFQSTSFYSGFGSKPFTNCPVNACVATNDRSYLERARVLLFHASDTSRWDVPETRSQNQLYVFFSHEAPSENENPLGALNEAFNMTMSYRRDSDVYVPYAMTVAGDGEGGDGEGGDGEGGDGEGDDVKPAPTVAATLVSSETVPAPAEPTVAWVVSNCHTPSLREYYVEELRRFITVDQYGACNGVPCGGEKSNDALSCYEHLARSHLFYLAFENHLCRDYITEKFWWALRAGMIPIVRGAAPSEYMAAAPPGSFLHVDDFAGPRELAQRLTEIASNTSVVAEMTGWRRMYRIGSGARWCELCARMREPDPGGGRVVPDLRRWWYGDAWCHIPTDS